MVWISRIFPPIPAVVFPLSIHMPAKDEDTFFFLTVTTLEVICTHAHGRSRQHTLKRILHAHIRTKPEILKTCYRHTLLLRLLVLSTPPLPRKSPDTEEGEEKHLHPRHPANPGGEGGRKEALEFVRTLQMMRQYLYFVLINESVFVLLYSVRRRRVRKDVMLFIVRVCVCVGGGEVC